MAGSTWRDGVRTDESFRGDRLALLALLTGGLCGFGIGVGIYRRPPPAPVRVDFKAMDDIHTRLLALEGNHCTAVTGTAHISIYSVPHLGVTKP
jgi:hypothetical protein